jgi:hypothetical protein
MNAPTLFWIGAIASMRSRAGYWAYSLSQNACDGPCRTASMALRRKSSSLSSSAFESCTPGSLVTDEPVVMHCYTTPEDIEDEQNLAQLAAFCRRMGREARQGEIGLIIGDEYFAIREFGEE